MNDRLTVDDNLLSNCSLSHFWTNLAPDAQRELLNSVLPLSGSEEVAGSANHKLTVTKDFLGNPLSNQTYQFIRIEHVLFIVLSEGFITSVSDGSNLLDFIKNYLKECYAMTSVADVSKLGVFKSYLKHFSI
jgi:hypothetical protein